MPDDIITQILNSNFLGIPTIIIIAMLVVVFIFLLKFKKQETFKRKNLTKEVRKELDELYNLSGERIGKPIRAGGFIHSGFALGFFPLFWDKNIPLKRNLEANKSFKKYAKAHPDLFDKEGNLKPDIEEMVCIKTSSTFFFTRVLTKMGLLAAKYVIVPINKYQVNEKELILDMFLNAQRYFGITIYSQAGKEFIENIAFKLNRENELDEFVNVVPKQNYLEISTASVVAKARENAKIEKEKYAGQIENAEEG